jgi:DNA-binding response OmpR family regulator
MTTPPIIIIISEPDSMISGVLRVEFSRFDFAVLLAEGSAAADAYASQVVASLVVLDASTAHLSAYEACARIRRRPGYAGRPIVLTVREVSPRLTAAAETAGATVLLAKPYSVMDLFRAITPHMQPNDPLLLAGGGGTGMADPPTREWSVPGSLEWRSGGDSALSRNKLLLPIVRGVGKKIPLVGKTS